MRKIKKIVHKAYSWKEAEDWDIQQQLEMSVEQRQAAAKELKRRIYGDNPVDVREAHYKK